MSGVSIDGAAVAVVTAGSAEAVAAAPPVPDRPAGWWRAWRDRFGLAEVCGTLAAVAGFAAGYAQGGSLLAAAALATICEAIGFYGCIAAKTGAAARRATTHLDGWRRLAAGAWHAVREQLASCAVAETVDGFLVRPGCLAGAAWLLRPLPGGVWLGFAVGKAAADVAWYGLEASARRGVSWSVLAAWPGARPAKPATPYLALDPARAAERFRELASVIGAAWRHGTVRVSLDVGAFHGLIEALESGRELRFPVTIPAAGHRMLVPCMLTGPSCDSQDTILDLVWLPEPRPGDQVLIGNAGAYTTCYSGRSAFNGYPAPGVRIVRQGVITRPVRDREKVLT